MSIGGRWKGLVGATGLAVVLALAFGGDGHAQTQVKGGWSTPVNLGSIVNSEYNEDLPHLSQDGASLYFISNRNPDAPTDFDIFVSHRLNGSWRRPRRVGGDINTSFNERGPCLSPDGHYLFFSSNRTDLDGHHGADNQDLYVSYRDDVSDDDGWQLPRNLGPAVNTVDLDFGAALLGDPSGKLSALLFARRVGGVQAPADIYMSPYVHGSFRPATPVTELNSPDDDLRPTIRPDGLQLFFNSNRPDSVLNDIWVSTRADILSPWSTPVNVGHPINTEFQEQFPAISADGGTLIFSSNRRDGTDSDLYVSTRQKVIYPWP
jgi:WD40-like Beta Propeller Repeat